MVTAQDPHQTEMTLEQKSAFIRKKLDELFPQPDIPLHHKDPFTLLVAVVLSAQTTDVQVNRVTTALFARAHTAEGMARLGEDEILRIIRPCGLAPQKARAIAALSRILVDKYGGRVPDNFADLEALPGVGHKSASVVMSQAYGKPAFRWIPTSIGWRNAGACPTARMSCRLRKISKPSFRLLHGQNCICS
jgi:endonuclease-3